MATVAIAVAGLTFSANAETFDEEYNTQKTDQYVFDTHAGHQYTFRYEHAGKIAVCSVSQNDGYGAFTFMVFPDRSTPKARHVRVRQSGQGGYFLFLPLDNNVIE